MTLALILSLIQPALSVIGAFKGTAAEAKAAGYMQDAVGVVSALTPLIEQFTSGKEVTADDVKAALAGKDAALKELDDLIAQKEREGK